MARIKTLLLLLLSGLAGIFLVQNAATVEIRFFVWRLAMPGALLVLLLLGAGIGIGLIAGSFLRRKGDGGAG